MIYCDILKDGVIVETVQGDRDDLQSYLKTATDKGFTTREITEQEFVIRETKKE